MVCWGIKAVTVKQHLYSFGLKSIAVFTKSRTEFKPVPTLEFTAAQIHVKAISSFYKLFPDILHTSISDKVASKSPQQQYIPMNTFEVANSGAA